MGGALTRFQASIFPVELECESLLVPMLQSRSTPPKMPGRHVQGRPWESALVRDELTLWRRPDIAVDALRGPRGELLHPSRAQTRSGSSRAGNRMFEGWSAWAGWGSPGEERMGPQKPPCQPASCDGVCSVPLSPGTDNAGNWPAFMVFAEAMGGRRSPFATCRAPRESVGQNVPRMAHGGTEVKGWAEQRAKVSVIDPSSAPAAFSPQTRLAGRGSNTPCCYLPQVEWTANSAHAS